MTNKNTIRLLKLDRPIYHYFTGAFPHRFSFTRSILYATVDHSITFKGRTLFHAAPKDFFACAIELPFLLLFCCTILIHVTHSAFLQCYRNSTITIIAGWWLFRSWVFLSSPRAACSCCPYVLTQLLTYIHSFILRIQVVGR